MFLWDAVFYLLATEGSSYGATGIPYIETNIARLQELTGLTRQALRKQLNAAGNLPPPYRLVESDGFYPGNILLELPGYQDVLAREKMILKPADFMRNGWAAVLNRPYPDSGPEGRASRFPLAVLNRLLMKPAGRTTSLGELVQRSRHPQRKQPPDTAQIVRAVEHLKALGLVEEASPEQYRVVRDQFALPAQQVWEALQREASEPEAPEVSGHLRRLDEELATLAERLAALGQFDPSNHLAEIFHDLRRFRLETDLPLLEEVVYRRRHRPPSRRRWHDTVKAFERALQRRSNVVQSPKVQLSFQAERVQDVNFALDRPAGARLRWARLVVWVSDDRFAFGGAPTPASLDARVLVGEECRRRWTLNYETGVVRCDLTSALREAGSLSCRLVVEADQLTRDLSLAAQLEAQFLDWSD